MKTKVLSTALLAAFGCAAGVSVAQVQGYGDVAKVVSATPVYDRVTESRRDCRVEQVNGYTERREVTGGSAPSGAGAVVGAIIGGVIGHQFGGSSAGRDHGTAAGAVVGGLVGNQVEKENSSGGPPETVVERTPVTREVERCRYIPETRDKVVGYDVTYQYNGHEFQARMPYDPGPEMPVNVDVRPPVTPRAAAWNGPATPSYRY